MLSTPAVVVTKREPRGNEENENEEGDEDEDEMPATLAGALQTAGSLKEVIADCLQHMAFEDALFLAEMYHDKENSNDSLCLVAECLLRMSRRNEVYALLKDAHTSHHRLRYLFAKTAFDLNKIHDAETALRRANCIRPVLHADLKRSPSAPHARALLSRILCSSARGEAGVACARDALTSNCLLWTTAKLYIDEGGRAASDIMEASASILEKTVATSSSSSSTVGATWAPKIIEELSSAVATEDDEEDEDGVQETTTRSTTPLAENRNIVANNAAAVVVAAPKKRASVHHGRLMQAGGGGGGGGAGGGNDPETRRSSRLAFANRQQQADENRFAARFSRTSGAGSMQENSASKTGRSSQSATAVNATRTRGGSGTMAAATTTTAAAAAGTSSSAGAVLAAHNPPDDRQVGGKAARRGGVATRNNSADLLLPGEQKAIAQKDEEPREEGNRKSAGRQELAKMASVVRTLAVLAKAEQHAAGCEWAPAMGALKVLLDRSQPRMTACAPQLLLARVHFEMEDYAAAIRVLEKVRELQPHRLKGVELLSTALWHVQDEWKLGELAAHAVRTARDRPEAWCAAGNAFSLAKQHDQAVVAFRRAVQLDARHSYALTLLGMELVTLEQFDRALAAFRTALALKGGRDFRVHYGVGIVYQRREQLALAHRSFAEAHALNPNNVSVMCQLALAEQSLGRLDRAKQLLADAIRLEPERPIPLFFYARFLFETHAYKECVEQLERLKRISPDEASVYYLLGRAYKQLNDAHLAQLNFSWATQMDPRGEEQLTSTTTTTTAAAAAAATTTSTVAAAAAQQHVGSGGGPSTSAGTATTQQQPTAAAGIST